MKMTIWNKFSLETNVRAPPNEFVYIGILSMLLCAFNSFSCKFPFSIQDQIVVFYFKIITQI